MKYVIKWAAYYSGGKMFTSMDTAIKALPAVGMLVWMLYFADGTRRVLQGNDVYFWYDDGSEDGIFANTDDSVPDIESRYPGAKIILGSLVSNAEYALTTKSAFREKI